MKLISTTSKILLRTIVLALVSAFAFTGFFLKVNAQPINHLVISMVYPFGGTYGTSSSADAMEIFNPTASPISLNGYSVQYSNGLSKYVNAEVTVLPNFILQPGQYFLVVEFSGGPIVGVYPAADCSGNIAFSSTSGKVFLVNSTTPLALGASGCPDNYNNLVDFVGYGTLSTVYCFEGPAPAAIDPFTPICRRNEQGCVDDNNNSSDFRGFYLEASNIHNSSFPIHICPAAITNITSITPSSGPVGTLVTITGANLSNPTAFSIGGVSAIAVSNDGTTLVGMVMPGATSGSISVTTATGTSVSGSNFTVLPTPYPSVQQGSKLVGTGSLGAANQGYAVSISADGNTAIVGGNLDNNGAGAAWVYIRSGGAWTQQGTKLVGTGLVGTSYQGYSVALSADGNTAIVGGWGDNANIGAAWVYTRSGGYWTQQGAKLVGTGYVGTAGQGSAVSLSADGNTAIVGGYADINNGLYPGAAWIFTRASGVWTQQGPKLVGTGNVGSAFQGQSVALSADGNTAIVGGDLDNGEVGAAWVFVRSGNTWTQQGNKLVGTGFIGQSHQGYSVSISADGNTAVVGGTSDNGAIGAAWVYIRSGGMWTQQGSKLVGMDADNNVVASHQGISVASSADGNTIMVGGHYDNNFEGAAWVYTRSGNVWTQQVTKLVGTGGVFYPNQGSAVALAADGMTAVVGGLNDNNGIGAAWVYIVAPPPTITTAPYASSLCFSPNSKTTSLSYSATTGSPTMYSIVWNASPANNFVPILDSALPLSPILISVPGNTPAGTYTGTITVKNANGLVSSGTTFTVTVYPAVTFPVNHTDATCYGATDGTITVNAPTGGLAPFTYRVGTVGGYTPLTNPPVVTTNKKAGTYRVYVHDANGCEGVVAPVVVAQPAKVTATATATNITCYGANNGKITLNNPVGVAAFKYKLGSTGSYIPFNAPYDIIGLKAGTYHVYIQDANGCVGPASLVASITEPAQVAASVTATNITCYGANNGTITLTNPTGVAPFKYKLNSTATYTSFTPPFNISGLRAGIYRVYMQDANGCVGALGIINMIQPVAMVITYNVQNICTGAPANSGAINNIATTNGTAPYTYTLRPLDPYISTTAFTNLKAATGYRIYAKDAGGCSAATGKIDILNGGCFTASPISSAIENNIKTDILGDKKITIYPNPATDRFTLQLSNYKPGKAEIVLANESGQIVERRSINISSSQSNTMFTMDKKATGTYFVKVITAEGVQVSKVVRQDK